MRKKVSAILLSVAMVVGIAWFAWAQAATNFSKISLDTTDEITLSNGETIDNSSDGIIDLSGDCNVATGKVFKIAGTQITAASGLSDGANVAHINATETIASVWTHSADLDSSATGGNYADPDVSVAGALAAKGTTFMGSTTDYVQISNVGAITFVGASSIDLPNNTVVTADITDGTVAAADIANVSRQINLSLAAGVIAHTIDTGYMTTSTAQTQPALSFANNMVGALWADADTDPLSWNFIVPADYASAGGFRVMFSEATGSATDCGLDWQLFSNRTATTWDTSASSEAVVYTGATAYPIVKFLTPAAQTFTAGDMITVQIWRTDGGAGSENVTLWAVQFEYLATQ